MEAKFEKTLLLKVYDDPLIFTIASGWMLQSGFRACRLEANGRPFHVIVMPYWHVQDSANDLVEFAKYAEAVNDNIKIHFICPSQEDADFLGDRGVDAIHAHHNSFLDEKLFRPLPDTPKRFAAIHNAALPKWKRHELAWEVKNICLVTYRHAEDNDLSHVSGYQDLAWSNISPDGNINFQSQEQICNLICSSKVGLILSEKEGGNFASGEYQFCGIPVISTRSVGGRHHFFDDKSTFIVPPNPESIAYMVEWVSTRFETDSTAISQQALNRAIENRERLLQLMSKISGQNVKSQANANAWHPNFKDKLRELISIPIYENAPLS